MFMMGLLFVGCEKEGDEKETGQELTVNEAPAAVKATIQQENPDKVPMKIKRLTENGKTVYAARIAKNGKEQEIYVSEDGKILPMEDREQEREDDD